MRRNYNKVPVTIFEIYFMLKMRKIANLKDILVCKIAYQYDNHVFALKTIKFQIFFKPEVFIQNLSTFKF